MPNKHENFSTSLVVKELKNKVRHHFLIISLIGIKPNVTLTSGTRRQ